MRAFGLPEPKTIARPPAIKTFPAFPTGPRDLANAQRAQVLGGPGVAPQGFVTATTSGSEWRVYWAGFQVFERNADPRKPPFFGTPNGLFVYQYAYTGGRHFLGGAVVDFVIYPYNGAAGSILVRLQTEEFHVFTTPQKHAYDALQQAELGKYGRVYDIFDQWILDDKGGPPGQAAIMALKDCVDDRLEINPLLSGQAQRVR